MTARSTMDDDSVLHYERAPNRAACGRRLPTAGHFTDDVGMMEVRRSSRCKKCWASLVRNKDVTP